MTPDRAAEALADLQDLPITRHAHKLPRIWQFWMDFSAYDAAYLALAEVFEATLITCDGPLGSSRLRCGSVEVF